MNYNLTHIFEECLYDGLVFNKLTEHEQLVMCEEYLPIGTVVDLDEEVMGGKCFSDGTRTATVIGYKPIKKARGEFDNYCVILNKPFPTVHGLSSDSSDYIHPSLLSYNKKFLRENKLQSILD